MLIIPECHMKKIAVLAANMYDWSHGTLYTQCFHPLTAAQAVEENLLWLDGPPVPGVEVAAIWSPDPQRSKKLAKLFGISDV